MNRAALGAGDDILSRAAALLSVWSGGVWCGISHVLASEPDRFNSQHRVSPVGDVLTRCPLERERGDVPVYVGAAQVDQAADLPDG